MIVENLEHLVSDQVTADPELTRRILNLVPQRHPFRFLDDILYADTDSIMGVCRFPMDAFFYEGHFPGNPLTPGVILIEAMAQTGVVAHGIYLMLQQGVPQSEISGRLLLFAYAERVLFERIVEPGSTVLIKGEKMYFRRNQLKSKVTMMTEDGAVICSGLLAGKGVNIHAE